jgi:hypothetical protein
LKTTSAPEAIDGPQRDSGLVTEASDRAARIDRYRNKEKFRNEFANKTSTRER